MWLFRRERSTIGRTRITDGKGPQRVSSLNACVHWLFKKPTRVSAPLEPRPGPGFTRVPSVASSSDRDLALQLHEWGTVSVAEIDAVRRRGRFDQLIVGTQNRKAARQGSPERAHSFPH